MCVTSHTHTHTHTHTMTDRLLSDPANRSAHVTVLLYVCGLVCVRVCERMCVLICELKVNLSLCSLLTPPTTPPPPPTQTVMSGEAVAVVTGVSAVWTLGDDVMRFSSPLYAVLTLHLSPPFLTYFMSISGIRLTSSHLPQFSDPNAFRINLSNIMSRFPARPLSLCSLSQIY